MQINDMICVVFGIESIAVLATEPPLPPIFAYNSCHLVVFLESNLVQAKVVQCCNSEIHLLLLSLDLLDSHIMMSSWFGSISWFEGMFQLLA